MKGWPQPPFSFAASAALGGVKPHRRIEGAAHQRHVHAEAGIGRGFRGRLGGLFAGAGCFGSPLPRTEFLRAGY